MRALLFVGLALPAGCIERPSPTAGLVNSLKLDLTEPADRGTPVRPISVREAVFSVTALDEQGQRLPVDADLDVFVSFGGVKVGEFDQCGTSTAPITRLPLRGGELVNQRIDLPQAFGSTSLWIDAPSLNAVGASDTIYFRNPFISDLMRPLDVNAPNATFCTPFNRKFVVVDRSETPGGKLVVSSVFGNAFAVSDSGASDFGHIYVYAFGRPPSSIVVGRVMKQISGNLSKFIGFTELNFPLFDATDEIDLAALPAPARVVSADTGNIPKLLGLVSGPVEVTGRVCNPEPPNPTGDPNIASTADQWRRFNTFTLDGDGTCESFTNFEIQLPTKVIGNLDPVNQVGQTVTVRGMLKNASGRNPYLDADGKPVTCGAVTPCAQGTCLDGVCKKNPFNFWSVVVRDRSDVP